METAGMHDGNGAEPRSSEIPEDRRKLDPRVRSVWRIKIGLSVGVAVLLAAAYDVSNLFDSEAFLRPGIASLAVVATGAFTLWLVPGFRYRFWWYWLSSEELVLERGIVNRVRTIVPLRRVQHIDVSQDIIEREYELGKLVVHTAGTRSSEILLPGLIFEEAERLRDRIKTYIHDEPV